MPVEHRSNRRIAVLTAVVALMTIAVAVRLVFLQAIDAGSYQTRARESTKGSSRLRE